MPLAVPSGSAASDARSFGAVALFEARVHAVDPRFELSDESLAVAIDICRRLDGLPLAIELAAARVATLGLRPVRDKLDARFRLLTGGSRASLRRHQTLRATLEWSHNLLSDAERAVFRRLAVFAGGFTMEMAQAVAGDEQLDEWAVLDHLGALIDKSLVVADEGDPPRYRLLESTCAFGLEQLVNAGETAETRKRHAVAVRRVFENADRVNLDGEWRIAQIEALLLPELDNLRDAHAWATSEAGDVNTAIVLAACATSVEDFAIECIDWLLPLRRFVEESHLDHGIEARYWRAVASDNMIDRVPLALQVEAAERALSQYRVLGQPRRVYSSLVLLAVRRLWQGDDAAAKAAADEARALIRPDWPAILRVRLLRFEGHLARHAGRLDEALARRRDAVQVSASTGDWTLEVIARIHLVALLWQIGPSEEAAGEARRLVDDLRSRPAAQGKMATAFGIWFGILGEMGCVDEARAAASEGLTFMRRARWYGIENWVHLFWRLGQPVTGTLLLGLSDANTARAGEPLEPIEGRLVAQASAGLKAQLETQAFANALTAGAALGEAEMLALISEGLAQAGGSRR